MVANRFERIVCSSSGPKSIRAIQKGLLVHGLQHNDHRPLQDFVLEGRDTEWPQLLAVSLRYVYTSHRWGAVRVAGLGTVEQCPEIVLQVHRIFRCCLTVDTRRSIFA